MGLPGVGTIRSLRRKLLLALIVLVPIFHLPGVSFDSYNQPKVTLLAIGVCAALTLRALEWAMSSEPRRELNGLVIPAAALVAPLTLSWLAAEERGWMVLGRHQRFLGLLPYVLFVVLGYLVADAFRGGPRPVVFALIASTTLVATYATWQVFGLDPFWKPGETLVEFPPSTIGHFNFSGGFVALGVAPAIWLWLSGGRGRLLGAVATALIAVGLIVSFSQGAWAAGAAAAVITVAYVQGGSGSWVRRVGWIVVIAIAAVTVGSVVASKFVEVNALATARTRAGHWAAALRMAGESPVVGSGPNAYYLTGESFRSLEDGVTTEMVPADDPHSVPLAMLANAGVLGLAGFLAVVVWGLRRSLAAVTRDPTGIALLGVIVAYLVQAGVTIDMPVLRLGLWSALGGVAALTPPLKVSMPTFPTFGRVGGAVVIAAGSIALSIAAVAFLLIPDLRAERAQHLLDRGRYQAATEEFASVIATRADPEYRIALAGALGAAAISAGAEGEVYIDQLRRATTYLAGFSDVRGESTTGYSFHRWAWFDGEVEVEALDHFERAVELGPSNVGARVGAAEALISLGRSDEAVEMLAPVARVAGDHLGEFWASYALILVAAGDRPGAEAALDTARSSGQVCRVVLAGELLRLTSGPSVRPDPDFLSKVRFLCDLPQLYLFAGLVPEDLRQSYVPDTSTD